MKIKNYVAGLAAAGILAYSGSANALDLDVCRGLKGLADGIVAVPTTIAREMKVSTDQSGVLGIYGGLSRGVNYAAVDSIERVVDGGERILNCSGKEPLQPYNKTGDAVKYVDGNFVLRSVATIGTGAALGAAAGGAIGANAGNNYAGIVTDSAWSGAAVGGVVAIPGN